MLLPGGGSAGCVYLDDLSALQRSIHEKINDLYSQRGETPEQDATLCLARHCTQYKYYRALGFSLNQFFLFPHLPRSQSF